MEMLTSTLLKSDFWTILIRNFGNWIGNYGWAVIVFTIILKLVLSPLDILQRISSGKQSRMMAIMQPELDEVKRKYGNDPQKLNIEQNKIYKKYQSNTGGMCFSMLLTLGITMVVFLTFFSSLRKYGSEKLYESYTSLDNAYIQAEQTYADLGEEEKAEKIREDVLIQYNKQSKQYSWLWVKNVWKQDVSKVNQFVSLSDYIKHVHLEEKQDEDVQITADREALTARYNAIVKIIDGDKKQPNGYYGLIIACVLISFLSQFISNKLLAQKGQKMTMMNKVMLAVIPLSMLLFAFNSNAMFTLYIITNSLMSTIISTIISLVMKKKNQGKSDSDIVLKKKNIEVVEYSRNYKK